LPIFFFNFYTDDLDKDLHHGPQQEETDDTSVPPSFHEHHLHMVRVWDRGGPVELRSIQSGCRRLWAEEMQTLFSVDGQVPQGIQWDHRGHQWDIPMIPGSPQVDALDASPWRERFIAPCV